MSGTPSSGAATLSSSSLQSALAAPHPLRAFKPAASPAPSDVDGLHRRIADCLSVCDSLVTRDGPAAVARLEKLVADAQAVLSTSHKLRDRVHKTGKSQRTPPPPLTDEDLSSFVERFVKLERQPRYSAHRPPPVVTKNEVDRAVATLTTAERKRLEDEFHLTCLDDFEWMSEPDDNDPLTEASPSAAVVVSATLPQSEAVTTPAFILEAQAHSTPVLSDHHVSAAAAAATVVPGFTLEAMPSSADSAHSDSHGADGAGQPVYYDASGACTVEVEYTMDRWALDAQTSPFLAGPEGRLGKVAHSGEEAFAVPPGRPHGGSGKSGRAHGEPERPEIPEGGETPPSFEAFSRLMLTQQRAKATAAECAQAASEEAVQHEPEPSHEPELPHEPQPPARVEAISATTAPSQRPGQERDCARFVRQRVRDVLLANKIASRERDRTALAVLAEAHKTVLATAQSSRLVVERLTALAQEAEVLLSALDGVQRSAIATRLDDPLQYLLVPRVRLRCHNVTCNKAFSTLVPRTTCRRCGQVFCPQCCQDRGLGPSVMCDDEPVSLGWEALCRGCFTTCEENQRRIAAERRRRRLIAAASAERGDLPAAAPHPSVSSPPPPSLHQDPSIPKRRPQHIMPSVFVESDKDGEEEERGGGRAAGSAHPSIEQLSVKEAVLSGACCGETGRLSDGFPPFYVATGADETAAAWDILAYRFSRLKGILLAQYQTTGLAAHRVVAGAVITATSNVHSIMPRRRIAVPAESGVEDAREALSK